MSETECHALIGAEEKLIQDKKMTIHDMGLNISMVYSEINYENSDAICICG